ncbi:MAG: Gfo/Idh/MocA family oxidoreductase [Pseudomonadota bacterium]
MSTPFRWAILGTGSVSRKFALGLNALGGRAIAASVASRDPENARRFAHSLGIAHAAESWDDAIGPDIDGVYIASPATEHEAHARLAFAKGKPALIEKPLGPDAATARRIEDAAQQAGVFAMEALWTRFLPVIAQVKSAVERGDLGDIRAYHGTFHAANVPDAQASLFDPVRAGGALLHRGIYPLSLARHFCGPITEVTARGRLGETGVDEDITVILTHENKALSTIQASLRTHATNKATLWGTQARVEIAAPIWRPEAARLIPTTAQPILPARPRRFEAFRESRLGQRIAALKTGMRGDGGTAMRAPPLGNGYAHEAQALMDAVAAGAGQSTIMPLSESIEVLEAIDTALAQIRKEPS